MTDRYTPAPGGLEWTIRHDGPAGRYEASILQVGATLRSLTLDGRPLLSGFEADQVRPAFRGALLLPWPNRIADGVYHYAGSAHQLALTEPERSNAMHGLLAWQAWEPAVEGRARLTAETTLRPQQGWDWTLTCRVTYTLDDEGLSVATWVRNESATAAPFGYGMHPYLTCGEERVDELEMSLPAQATLRVDGQRLLPVQDTLAASLSPVSPELDLRDGAPLGGRCLDTAYTRLDGDADGRWRAVLRHPTSSRTTTLWAPLADFGWAQVFTGDSLPPPARRTTGVAVEPMTCGPDAMRTGEGIVELAPGGEWSATWGISGT